MCPGYYGSDFAVAFKSFAGAAAARMTLSAGAKLNPQYYQWFSGAASARGNPPRLDILREHLTAFFNAGWIYPSQFALLGAGMLLAPASALAGCRSAQKFRPARDLLRMRPVLRQRLDVAHARARRASRPLPSPPFLRRCGGPGIGERHASGRIVPKGTHRRWIAGVEPSDAGRRGPSRVRGFGAEDLRNAGILLRCSERGVALARDKRLDAPMEDFRAFRRAPERMGALDTPEVAAQDPRPEGAARRRRCSLDCRASALTASIASAASFFRVRSPVSRSS